MLSVIISPKYQIVIPKEIREALHWLPGQKLQVFRYQNRVEFVLAKDVKKMRGFLKGMDTSLQRDEDRM